MIEFTLLDHFARMRLHPVDRCMVRRLYAGCTDMELAVERIYELAGRGA